MTLLVLAYLGGVLTIVSPCILPVLPFVFARADRPFLTNALPMLAGMAHHLRRGRDLGGCCRRMGRRSQPVWPNRRAGAHGGVRADVDISCVGRPR